MPPFRVFPIFAFCHPFVQFQSVTPFPFPRPRFELLFKNATGVLAAAHKSAMPTKHIFVRLPLHSVTVGAKRMSTGHPAPAGVIPSSDINGRQGYAPCRPRLSFLIKVERGWFSTFNVTFFFSESQKGLVSGLRMSRSFFTKVETGWFFNFRMIES